MFNGCAHMHVCVRVPACVHKCVHEYVCFPL